ncbi:hypothetical protein [Spirosoma areae]
MSLFSITEFLFRFQKFIGKDGQKPGQNRISCQLDTKLERLRQPDETSVRQDLYDFNDSQDLKIR